MLIVLIPPYENTGVADRLAATRESRPICCVCAFNYPLMVATYIHNTCTIHNVYTPYV